MAINLSESDRKLSGHFWLLSDLADDDSSHWTVCLLTRTKIADGNFSHGWNDCKTDREEKRVKTHNDLLKLLSDTIPSGSLPQILVASLHIWRWNIKGFLKAGDTVGYWMFLHLQVASITNTHRQRRVCVRRTHTLKAHPRHRRSSLDVSKGAVLERQQERCEEEKICGLWPWRKWFIQDYKASPQDQCLAAFFGLVATTRIAETPFLYTNDWLGMMCRDEFKTRGPAKLKDFHAFHSWVAEGSHMQMLWGSNRKKRPSLT